MGDMKQGKKHSPFLIVCLLLLALVAVFFWRKDKTSDKQTDRESVASKTSETESVVHETHEVVQTGSKEVKGEAPKTQKFKTWGPERIMYSWGEHAETATINSMTNNPATGDERNFVRIRKADSEDKFGDNVVAEIGAEYEVQVFVDNNADSSLDSGSGETYAQNIRLIMQRIPENINKGENVQIKGTITTTNATPEEVWDTAYIQANESISLRYIRNSCRLRTGGELNGKLISDEALFGVGEYYKGTKLGYDRWGLLPGGGQYGCSITFRLKVDKTKFDMDCTVSKEGANDYHNSIDAVPGEVLDMKIHFKNTGTTLLKDVVTYDNLGDGLTFVPGTTRIYNDTNPDGTIEKDNLFSNGFNIGDYKGGMEALICYKVRVVDDQDLFPCGETVVVQNDSAIGVRVVSIRDKIQIRVHRDCESDTMEPSS